MEQNVIKMFGARQRRLCREPQVSFSSVSSFLTETNLSLSDYFNDDGEMSLANPHDLESQERLPHLYILVGFKFSNINHKLKNFEIMWKNFEI